MSATPLGPVMRLRLAADLALFAVLVAAAFGTGGFAPLARYMPLFATGVGAILAAALFVRDLLRARRLGGDAVVSGEAMDTAVLVDDDLTPGQALLRAATQLAWFVAYALAIFLLGILPASALFIAVFLYLEGGMRWPSVLLSSGVAVGLLLLIGNVLNLRWPATLWGG